MEAEGAVGDRRHHEEDGEDAAEEEAEVDAVVVTSGTDLVRTQDPEAGVRAGACHDHLIAGHLHGHRRAEGAAEVGTAGETHHREEEAGAVVVVEGGARAMTHTTARDPGVEAEIADSLCFLDWSLFLSNRLRIGSCSITRLSSRCPLTVAMFDPWHRLNASHNLRDMKPQNTRPVYNYAEGNGGLGGDVPWP